MSAASQTTRKKRIGLALLCVGVASLGAALVGSDAPINRFAPWMPVLYVLTVVVTTTGLLMIGTGHRSKTAAMLRLDLFLPFLRKKKSKETLPPPSRWQRLASRWLPKSLLSDRITGRPGWIRKALGRLGPTMLSSPFRRVVQCVAFVAFLLLFFYVCWPYTARPENDGQASSGWRFIELKNETGQFIFENPHRARGTFSGEQRIYAALHEGPDRAPRVVAAFKVDERGSSRLSVSPAETLDADQFDLLLTSPGPWHFYERDPNRWPSHYADDLANKEIVPAESFLVIDPLVSLSTAIAARSWIWSLVCGVIILLICVLIPRGFCGYLCPLGTLIDLFDWSIAARVKRFQVPDNGWWVHLKYYLLMGTLLSAMFGVLVSGYVAAIPVITRGLLLVGEPLQIGLLRGWHQVPPLHIGHFVSITLFVLVLALGFLRPRFWCKYVCPSGAVFSLGNFFRITERKVESSCIHCNKCVEICPFDAIKADFTTRTSDCTLCQTCGGVCPTQAIKFVERWNVVELKVNNDPPTGELAIGRRGFLSWTIGTTAAGLGAAAVVGGSRLSLATSDFVPVRPPGSVPEHEFLQMCIRCGECFKACPNNVLQLEHFQQGIQGLWTPLVNANWAGCESSCNACGQVCPTGAIRALPLEEKKVARMGLAIINEETCLPLAGREACQLCVDECNAAGYRAIEFMQVHTAVDEQGIPIEGSGFLAPVVVPELCVGCGLCQTRCYNINAKNKKLMKKSAIIIEAGEGKEDRLMSGSYLKLYASRQRKPANSMGRASSEYFVPELELTSEAEPSDTPEDQPAASDDPFGLD